MASEHEVRTAPRKRLEPVRPHGPAAVVRSVVAANAGADVSPDAYAAVVLAHDLLRADVLANHFTFVRSDAGTVDCDADDADAEHGAHQLPDARSVDADAQRRAHQLPDASAYDPLAERCADRPADSDAHHPAFGRSDVPSDDHSDLFADVCADGRPHVHPDDSRADWRPDCRAHLRPNDRADDDTDDCADVVSDFDSHAYGGADPSDGPDGLSYYVLAVGDAQLRPHVGSELFA